MSENKPKEGVSVKEMEEFAKKYRLEVFFCLLFLLALIFGLVGYFRMGWSIFFGMGGAILGVLFPTKLEQFAKMVNRFIFDQDKIVQIVLGVVALLIAVFFPFLIFMKVGMVAGRAMLQMAMEAASSPKK